MKAIIPHQTRVFDVSGQAPLPRLSGLPGASRVVHHLPVAVESIEFDTRSGVLAAHGAGLTRTAGGPREGWTLTIRTALGPMESFEPLSSSESAAGAASPARGATTAVPSRLRDLVLGLTRGLALEPVARRTVLYSAVDLIDHTGATLAQIADEQIASTAVGSRAARVSHRRQWSILPESAPTSRGADQRPDDGLVDAIAELLTRAGATEALPADRGETDQADRGGADPADRGGDRQGDDAEAGTVADAAGLRPILAEALREPATSLLGWDPLVRVDEPDSIHQMRVAARTLRSILQTYRSVFARDRTKALDAELKEFGRLLSTARDAEVIRDLIEDRAADLPDGVLGGVVGRGVVKDLVKDQADDYRKAHKKVHKAMSSQTYFAMLDAIDAFIADIPLAADLPADADAAPATVLRPLLDAQMSEVLDAAGRARDEEDVEERIERMHDVRKDAKRLRYAIAAVTGDGGVDFGERLEDRMSAARKMQNVLGDHRDSVMFSDCVRAAANREKKDGRRAFALGVLYAAEFPLRAKLEKKLGKLMAKLRADGDEAAGDGPPEADDAGQAPDQSRDEPSF